jgi:hypothetical protein
MGKTPGGSGGEEGESDEGAGSMRSTHGVEAQRTAVGKRRAWQEHVAEALPWVLSTNSMGSLPAADAGAARAAGSEDEAAGHARPADEPTPERGAQAKRARGGSGAGMSMACQQPTANSWGSPPATGVGSMSCEPEGGAWSMSTGEVHGAPAPGSTTGEGPRQSLQSMACQQPTANSWGSLPATGLGSSETQGGAWSKSAGEAHGECISVLNKTTSPQAGP